MRNKGKTTTPHPYPLFLPGLTSFFHFWFFCLLLLALSGTGGWKWWLWSVHNTPNSAAPSSGFRAPARDTSHRIIESYLFQCFTTLMVKSFFLVSNLNLPSFSLKTFPLVLSLHTLVKSPSPRYTPSWTAPAWVLSTGYGPSGTQNHRITE